MIACFRWSPDVNIASRGSFVIENGIKRSPRRSYSRRWLQSLIEKINEPVEPTRFVFVPRGTFRPNLSPRRACWFTNKSSASVPPSIVVRRRNEFIRETSIQAPLTPRSIESTASFHRLPFLLLSFFVMQILLGHAVCFGKGKYKQTKRQLAIFLEHQNMHSRTSWWNY